MSTDQWQIDLERQTAVHESGFTVHVDGNLRLPFSVSPTNVPSDFNVIKQAALLREGLQVMVELSEDSQPRQGHSYDYDDMPQKPEKKCRIVNKPAFVPPANRPERPVLSLKSRKKATNEA